MSLSFEGSKEREGRRGNRFTIAPVGVSLERWRVEVEEEGEDDSLDVVHKALAAIIGENPSEDQKLSQEVIQLCVSLLFSLVFTN